MAATVEVHCFVGAGPTGTGNDITTSKLRHKLGDTFAPDFSSPIKIPASGTIYSWRKHTKLYLATSVGTTIDTIRWFAYAAPADWANSVLLYAIESASYTQGSQADETALVDGMAEPADNVDQHDAGNPIALTTGTLSSTGYGNQNYVVQQMGILSTATSGIKTGRTCTYRYNES